MCAKMVKTPNMDDCNELMKSVAEVEAGVTKTLATDLLASCIENAVRISSRKEDGCDARKWPRGAERTWKLSGRLLLCRPWTGTVDVDGGQGQGQWSGKSEQESQEELRMFLDDLSFVNSV